MHWPESPNLECLLRAGTTTRNSLSLPFSAAPQINPRETFLPGRFGQKVCSLHASKQLRLEFGPRDVRKVCDEPFCLFEPKMAWKTFQGANHF